MDLHNIKIIINFWHPSCNISLQILNKPQEEQKMKTKKALWILTPVLIVALATTVFAQGNFSRCVNNPRLKEALELTPEQEEKIDAIHSEFEENRIDLKASMEKAQLKLREEMKKDETNEELVMDLVEEGGQIKIELRKIGIREILSVKSILTPEQREKAKDAMGKMHSRREEFRNKHQNRGKEGRSFEKKSRRRKGNEKGSGFQGKRFRNRQEQVEEPMDEDTDSDF
jgi:Spy/CpxP family protein refolding chaperone